MSDSKSPQCLPNDDDDSHVNCTNHLYQQPEDLDDDEFQLPQISVLPTLESILNEDDDPGSVSDSELNLMSNNSDHHNALLGDGGETSSVHSKASSDSKSHTSSEKLNRLKKDIPTKYHGSVLRHVALKGIATQTISANERVGAGLPTSMAVGTVICIGTSHGHVLVFDPSQALKWCLGTNQQDEQYGAVSALALNQESSRLLVGFAKGHICLFDVVNGKLLQNIPDAHTPFTAVLHLKWTDCPGLALLSDSGGSVFEISIKRLMGLNSNESKCIFSGSRGEVCTIEPLIMGQFLSLPPAVDTVIVAMATMSKVIVVSLRPHLKVHFSHPLESSAPILPLLAWQFVIIQMPDGSKVIDPVLAFGRGSTLFFYQLTHGAQDELTFIFLQKVDASYSLQSIAWLNSRTLAVMDTREKLHVIDMKSQDELDMVDLARLGLVYASSHFKGLATGGNVSQAMAAAGERACYHSMISFGSQILLLGTKSFQVVTMRSWIERLEHMIRAGNIGDALLLALDILKERAQGIVGLTHKKEKRRQLLKSKILDLLNIYLEHSKSTCPDRGNLIKLKNFYQQVLSLCVKVCVDANFQNILFGKIWDHFSEDTISREIFLEVLEPYILDDQLHDLPPVVSQYLLSHYEDRAALDAAEGCIVHMNITSLDLHQTLTLCWTYGLYDALFYIYTRGMNDYVSPLEELFVVLSTALDSGSPLNDNHISLGNKILVYISCCLAGRAYPYGSIDPDLLKKVKHEVFMCITCLHTKSPKEGEQQYPHLRILLKFDTREFLNVLAIAFEEEEFTSELGLIQRQRVVDILLQIMVDNSEFNAVQIGSLFTFIARQMLKQQDSLALNKNLFQQVLSHLTDPQTQDYHEERQTALLELLQEGGLAHFEKQDLQDKAKAAQFYRVLEYIYEGMGNYGSILECYVCDKMRKLQSFSFIKTVLNSTHFTAAHKAQVRTQFFAHIRALLKIDTAQVASLLISYEVLTPLISRIAESLLEDKELLYDYLQAIFATRSSMNSAESTNSASCLDDDDSLLIELQEQYISLMAELHPHQVYHYLRGINGYKIDEILKICKRFQLDEAEAFLLEMRGDIKGAYDIHLNLLKVQIYKDRSTSSFLANVKSEVLKVMRFCRLGSIKVDESGRRDLWFPLLDILLGLQPTFASQDAFANEVRSIMSHVVNSMMPHISLSAILERIMEDPGYAKCNFGQIKHLLKDMVECYTYEETLYSSIVSIIRKDQLFYLAQVRHEASSPISVMSTSCSICHQSLHSSQSTKVFSCGHCYHEECGSKTASDHCAACNGTSIGYSKNPTASDVASTDEAKQAQLDDVQVEGLTRISILDSCASGASVKKSPKPSQKALMTNGGIHWSSNSLRDDGQDLSNTKEFTLKLAPPSLQVSFDE